MLDSLDTPAAASPRWSALESLRAQVMSLCAALQFLTIVPALVRRPFTAAEMGRAVAYFPLTGILLGAGLVAIHHLVAMLWSRNIAAALVLCGWVVLTGGLHLDGFLDSCDALLGGRSPEDRLRIMRDPHLGSFALAGGVLLLLLKFQALAALVEPTLALLSAPTLGRWSMSVAIVLFPYARPTGLGRDIKDHAGVRELAVATTILGLLLLLAASATALVILAAAALATVAIALFAQMRIPGLTGDVYGAICELGEAAVLLGFASGVAA